MAYLIQFHGNCINFRPHNTHLLILYLHTPNSNDNCEPKTRFKIRFQKISLLYKPIMHHFWSRKYKKICVIKGKCEKKCVYIFLALYSHFYFYKTNQILEHRIYIIMRIYHFMHYLHSPFL